MHRDDDAQRRGDDRPGRPAGRSTVTGTAIDIAPRDISSEVRADPRRRTSPSSRLSTRGSTTLCRVSRVRLRRTWSTTSSGAAASSTLPTPVACSGSRLPTWLTTGTDSRPEIRSTYSARSPSRTARCTVSRVAVCTSSRNGEAT